MISFDRKKWFCYYFQFFSSLASGTLAVLARPRSIGVRASVLTFQSPLGSWSLPDLGTKVAPVGQKNPSFQLVTSDFYEFFLSK